MNAIATDWRQQFGTTPPKFTPEEATEYAEWLISFQKRPWDWVCACYPWGVPGSPLAKRRPELWQRLWLKHLQDELQREDLTPDEVMNRVIRMAVAAGHGVGKTALVGWIIHWFVSCYPGGRGVITASTATQLETKTWRTLVEWQNLACNGWMVEWSATRYRQRDLPSTWYCSAIPWSEHNAQAFAGEHGEYVLIIFDEASAIAAIIWEVIKGAFTTGLIFFFVFGNPTEGDGGFYDCFHKEASLWFRMRVDAREVTFSNKKEIEAWIALYGADSDFCRTRIYGMFPKQSATSFISTEVVQRARDRDIEWKYIPRVVPRLMGVDLARGGEDLSAIVKRQGRKVFPKIKEWAERDAMISADYIAREINEWQPDMVFIDGGGLGGPVIDYLCRRGYRNLIVEVQSGRTPNTPDEAKFYANMRTVMWARMREALPYMDLPKDDNQLAEELCSPKFRFQLTTDRMILEPKDEMKARGAKSPNRADALSFTYWYTVPTANIGGSGIAEPEEV